MKFVQLPGVVPFSANFRIFEHILSWDGVKTWRMTLLPSYLLYFSFKSIAFASDGIYEVYKTKKFDHIQGHKVGFGRIPMVQLNDLPYSSIFILFNKTNSVLQFTIVLEIWPDLQCIFGEFCVLNVFRIFEHGEDK